MTEGTAIHPRPFDHVAFMLTPDLPPSTGKGRDDRPPPQPVLTLGHAIGMTIDCDGFAWLYVEPADAYLPVVRVPLIHCRRACPPEVTEYGNVRRRTLDALCDLCRARFATPTDATPTDATPTQDSQP